MGDDLPGGGGGGPCAAAAAARRHARVASPLLMCAADADDDADADVDIVDDAVDATAAETDADSSAAGGASLDRPVLILGAGWVGSRVAKVLSEEEGVQVVVTNRPGTSVESKPPYFRPLSLTQPPITKLDFDLEDRATWAGLPEPEGLCGVILTFPVTEADAFWDAYLSKVPNVVCYSSTSVYQVDKPGQTVTEATPIRPTPRAIGEAFLLERGATVLTISGIFGENRTPRAICTCLSTYTSAGGALNGAKLVNMVHVDDIVAATLQCLRTRHPGARINVAGHHFMLSELITHCKHPPIPSGPDTDLSSKCVCSDRLLTEVMPAGFDFVPPIPAGSKR